MAETIPLRPRVHTPAEALHSAAETGHASAPAAGPARVDGDDEHGRELVVPRGTFASEVPPQKEAASREVEATDKLAIPESSRPTPASKLEGRADLAGEPASSSSKAIQSSSQRVRIARAPERPPFLASEILREDLAPREPGRDMLAAVISAAAIAGLISVLVAGLQTIAAVVLALLFVGLFAIGRLKLSYATRALAVAAVSGVALFVVAWTRYAGGSAPQDLLLVGGCVLLPGSLYVRAWYRGSLTARVLVGLAIAPSCAWAFLTSHRELLSLEFIWQSWLPALTWYLFVILCLLALLAFMGDETTGGCAAWAVGLCVWYACFAGVRFALEVDTLAPLRTLGLAEPALAAPLSVALAQLIAHLVGRRTRQRAQVLTNP